MKLGKDSLVEDFTWYVHMQ